MPRAKKLPTKVAPEGEAEPKRLAPDVEVSLSAQLPTQEFARAWINVTLATSKDPDRQEFRNTILFEEHDHGLILVATDTFALFYVAVPFVGHTESFEWPTLDKDPHNVWIVQDPDHMGSAFASVLMKSTKDDQQATINLYTADAPSAGPGEQPALDPMFTRHIVLEAFDQQIRLPLLDAATWPNWRALDAGEVRLRRATWVAPRLLVRLARLKGCTAIELAFVGNSDVIRIEGGNEVDLVVRGFVNAMQERA